MTPPSAILLIAHGSRRAAANQDLVQLAEMVQQEHPEEIVEVSYLELAEPTIPQGAERCVERGAKTVLMFPYFLSAGTHVVDDLEEFRQEFQQRWPDIRFVLCPHLGLHPLMVKIVLSRLEESSSSQH
ncbi:MAG: CbiX/SirB N-terminal domain-containing protein [Planctomycetaceae bacterium]|nr:CbiX/SirB N-terminal domain-containing protein [Planctomycetaceae bacterium]